MARAMVVFSRNKGLAGANNCDPQRAASEVSSQSQHCIGSLLIPKLPELGREGPCLAGLGMFGSVVLDHSSFQCFHQYHVPYIKSLFAEPARLLSLLCNGILTHPVLKDHLGAQCAESAWVQSQHHVAFKLFSFCFSLAFPLTLQTLGCKIIHLFSPALSGIKPGCIIFT